MIFKKLRKQHWCQSNNFETGPKSVENKKKQKKFRKFKKIRKSKKPKTSVRTHSALANFAQNSNFTTAPIRNFRNLSAHQTTRSSPPPTHRVCSPRPLNHSTKCTLLQMRWAQRRDFRPSPQDDNWQDEDRAAATQ
jgi:hypothetical protein